MNHVIAKNLKITIAAVLVINLGMMAGCASIVNGTTQAEKFKSVPAGARIKIDNVNYARTPAKVLLSRSTNHTINVSLPGYKSAEFKLTKHVSGWLFGNILFGGIIGIVVDAADGSMYTLEPDQIGATGDARIEPEMNSITVVLMRNVPKSMRGRKVGQLHRS